MRDSKRFVSLYWWLNPLLIACYVAVRLHFEHMSAADVNKFARMKSMRELQSWENQCLMTLGAIFLFKLWRKRSWDNYIMQVFYYAKLLLLMMAFMVDIRVFVWLAIAAWGLSVVMAQPMYDLEGAGVAVLNPTYMKEFVLQRSDNTPSWVVFCYAENHADSLAMAPVVADLAKMYASPGLQFGSLDVTLWPQLTADLGVTSQIWENKLPSVILFEKGKEVARVPTKAATRDFTARNFFTRKDILTGLDLEARAAKATGSIMGGMAAAKGKEQQHLALKGKEQQQLVSKSKDQ